MTRPGKIITTTLCCGLAAAVVAGCGQPTPTPLPTAAPATPEAGGGQVPPGQELASFRRALAMRGLPTGDDRETTLYARTICAELDQGSPPQQVVVDVQTGTGLDIEDTGFVVGAALAGFCPHNLAKVQR